MNMTPAEISVGDWIITIIINSTANKKIVLLGSSDTYELPDISLAIWRNSSVGDILYIYSSN